MAENNTENARNLFRPTEPPLFFTTCAAEDFAVKGFSLIATVMCARD